MKVCKGCKRDEGLRFSFDGDPLCKYCAPIAANVVQVLENDHAPSVAPGECCTACNFVKDCGCGTCVGSVTGRVAGIFGAVPERIAEMLKYAPKSAA